MHLPTSFVFDVFFFVRAIEVYLLSLASFSLSLICNIYSPFCVYLRASFYSLSMSVAVCFVSVYFDIMFKVSLKYFNYNVHFHNIISVSKLQVVVLLDSKKQTVNQATTDTFSLLPWNRFLATFSALTSHSTPCYRREKPLIEWVLFVGYFLL